MRRSFFILLLLFSVMFAIGCVKAENPEEKNLLEIVDQQAYVVDETSEIFEINAQKKTFSIVDVYMSRKTEHSYSIIKNEKKKAEIKLSSGEILFLSKVDGKIWINFDTRKRNYKSYRL